MRLLYFSSLSAALIGNMEVRVSKICCIVLNLFVNNLSVIILLPSDLRRVGYCYSVYGNLPLLFSLIHLRNSAFQAESLEQSHFINLKRVKF